MLLGLLFVAGAVVDANAASIVTGLVTTALANEQRLEVISSADVRRQLDLEASRQSMGCDVNASSCLADVAGAMGARLVVSGQLGTLGDVVILTLNLFDSNAGAAVGRVSIKEASLEAVGGRVDAAVAQLIAPFMQSLPPAAGQRARVLVLDIEPPTASTSTTTTTAPPPAASSPLFSIGVGGLIGGAVVAGVGGVLLVIASGKDGEADKANNAVAANALYDDRDVFGGWGFSSLGVGAVVAVAGGVALAVSE